MGILQRVMEATGLRYRAEGDPAPSYIAPPLRSAGNLTTDSALSISTVYRAIQILATAGAQLGVTVERAGSPLPADQLPSIIRRPSLEMDRDDFIEQTITSMATAGNGYWKLVRVQGELMNVQLLNPHEVAIADENGKRTYHHAGQVIRAHDMIHIPLLRIPGKAAGLGPIQAARAELTGALDMRDYASDWFRNSGVPSGILASDQPLNAAEAKQYRELWESTENPNGVRVLGKGLTYKPVLLNPADAQWLENQQFTTTQIARLFGTPASLMLAAVEGNSQTYANVEQDWIAFERFTLMQYLRKIENALTSLTVRGQRVRFNIESLLRTDTKTRYDSYAVGLGRWLTVDEIRAIEKLPPLTDAQRAELTAAPAHQELTQ